ncbi:DNA helicase UvrD [Candidatus Falkowbacteria bacterium RIFOXYB2_FULL_34_18]|uniref:DNA helicase UvrD n=1 Tax=Candidatus Falkowbacteria bacterium RIFOXYD2_FULL_34_120 TaxID=1798007 RepID=A0A1F5TQX2_9BACT|nr:MAG: DNA helicase UvrD [Candidatus Falkowbacteria bacterium RIFOXYB2_FULL_34_18]OGF29826.1 MAG: DNA helicase UvrD [Candidatus Falkowbacteria bacterium RIFOXYC12_FULL_34_55]OGF37059.1 MAG: DNA helicase UvrD [Candidatus Falkowbacteria bacterium RIFOXYC2_FULL_34_220]OGF39251.1 MAG: DNA helicase UvrD [Candidatus Falkowbacteria bacterium RIFOXYD12_FULL_34_57]OGF41356.1 MAG: DNA helicase UvrD [Candidatus Falkowbacteria bacterium RIFOXYD2_FULL_34_120]
MKQIADLHIHSKFSRACSRDLSLENINRTCRIKGVHIIATGDFTFPNWFFSIKEELEEIEKTGLYKLKTADNADIKFLLSTEVALIYKKNGQCRRLHIMLHAPDLKAVEELNKYLDKKYNIRSDGRPILGMSAEELVKLCLSIHPKFLIYPAHIWTPWFAVFGSKSGFDSMEECFEDYTKYIYAYETGLSSDPEMNWRLSALDHLTLLSNSDAHSLPNIAREANVFDLENPGYPELYEVIKNKDVNKLKYTIEFYPEEGMYHYDGHRSCGVCFSPKETKKHKGVCPRCGKDLVIGVDNRVDELADRKLGFRLKEAPGFKKLIELDKIIAESLGIKSRGAKKVQEEYNHIIKNFGNELDILMDIPLEKLKINISPKIVEGIRRVRSGELIIEPGFDGQYGKVKIFEEEEEKRFAQASLF